MFEQHSIYKEGVQEVKEVVKENIAHLPDGHR